MADAAGDAGRGRSLAHVCLKLSESLLALRLHLSKIYSFATATPSSLSLDSIFCFVDAKLVRFKIPISIHSELVSRGLFVNSRLSMDQSINQGSCRFDVLD